MCIVGGAPQFVLHVYLSEDTRFYLLEDTCSGF